MAAGRDPSSVLFFTHMQGMTTRGLRRKMGDAGRLIDSTGLRLAGASANWARFSAEVCGVKAHVGYDPDLGCPIYHMITEAKVNDIVAAKRCRSRPARPMSLTWAITTMAGGRAR
jgi:Transposase DDE domain